MSEGIPRKNASLIAKSNARLAAAQLLYRIVLMGEALKPEKLTAEYEAYLLENADNRQEAAIPSVPAHKPTLKKLLEGIAEHGETLERLVDENLSERWRRERMSPLMVAILKLGIFELDATRTLQTPILVDEYTTLAHRFFNEEDASFVHAFLWGVANKLRG